ncbi:MULTISPECIES: efflux RND transporter periplasmic adaptor subunit [Pseudoalteromonas]|uniref:HlyD family efflux transporter periplasmic adaptor subunit n=1 Tax=Pseudoalteromonas maricaloris TaxID=184924 RepID=A0A8I2KMT3_9GAMM|nr:MULTISPECIES: HlyD family efflux transporter periplasmic adaptor subunit [Pseudoalteromonas]NLR22026.1 HlyD family efflux transporter periplasmic adaptor subunit [Pseudoalteromonas maricaloris]RZG13435.1 HlyD family efflux transporter periplasmic adaptor subunit [Pseudoalteromonas sp. CO342X]WOX28558.1 HlyD family efflux transporter periplasmic adaptor subunit [Pseudoalteromonas maricaloris]
MDLVKPAKPKKTTHYIVVICLMSVIVVYLLWQQWAPHSSVMRAEILVAEVKQGPLTLSVDSFGELRSAEQFLLNAQSAAIVKVIHHKAGAIIRKGDVIAELMSPDLVLQVQQAKQALRQSWAIKEQLLLSQQREQLNEQKQLMQKRGELKTLVLRHRAEQNLAQQGIISALNFAQTETSLSTLQHEITMLEQQAKQLQALHGSALTLANEEINIREQELNNLLEKQQQLEIRASTSGVIERMPLALGQRVNVGDELALIGSNQSLVAVLSVPQSQVRWVETGQDVMVNMQANKVKGKVIRVDPVVTNNSVEVEVSLPNALPKQARAQLSISASVAIKHLANATYVQRPANAKDNQTQTLFALTSDDTAKPIEITFGASTGKYIVIDSGVEAGRRLIISDLAYLASLDETILLE